MFKVLRLGSSRKTVLLTTVFALVVWFWALTLPFSSFHLDLISNRSKPLSETSDLFDFEPADSEAIRKICQNTEWNQDLVFTCARSGGGVGNLRNSILNCIRYAINAGGALVIPRVILRSTVDIAAIWNKETIEMDYIFDRVHFIRSLELSCLQLQIFSTTNEIPDYDPARGGIPLLPEKLVGDIPGDGIAHPEEWRGLFYEWLETSATQSHKPVVVDLDRSYLQYPIYTDGEPFALEFGKILKFRSDARVLATTTVKNLLQMYQLHADTRQVIFKNGYFGVHLRTEKDSQQGWPPSKYEYSKYETQSKFYLEQAVASKLTVIYAASGDASQLSSFSEDAKRYNFTVTTKQDLLQGDDRKQLEAMTFDQQALVDWLVLLRSSEFAGVGHSSFAWNIALWRHQFAERRDHLNGPQLMSDELSQIYGTVNQYPEYASCLWP